MSAASLKVTTASRPGSRLAVEMAVPAERSQASYEEAINRLSRSVNLPGFRKGKVPRTVLVQQLGALRIRATALETLVESIWRDALAQETIEALGQPELSGGFEELLDTFKPGEALTVTMETDVAPSPKLKSTQGLQAEAESVAALAFALIENHYFINKGWFKTENQLIENIEIIRSIPSVIVQGRYDAVCPMKTAWELSQAWPEAEMIIAPASGHTAFEKEITHALISATDKFGKK